jgi:hypothetical protein
MKQNEAIDFYLSSPAEPLDSGRKEQALYGFLYSILMNDRKMEIPNSSHQIDMDFKRWLKVFTQEQAGNTERIALEFARVFSDARNNGHLDPELFLNDLEGMRPGDSPASNEIRF